MGGLKQATKFAKFKDRFINMKRVISIFIIILFFNFMFCKEKIEPNKVDINQIDNDSSNDYKYIFKEEIEREKRLEKKYKKDEFK